MKDVECYAVGIVNISCCALKSLSSEDVATHVNKLHPSGIGPWTIAEEKTFAGGDAIPNQCEHNKDRQHWLLHC
jgi:hypothetical protein